MCWRSSARARRARRRPGSSTPTASSPRAPRPTPGSSPATARWSPARPTSAILHGVTRATLIDVAARDRAAARAAPVLPRRGFARPRGVLLQRVDDRHAGRRDRRASRSATAGPARWRSRCAGVFTRSPTRSSSWTRLGRCGMIGWAVAPYRRGAAIRNSAARRSRRSRSKRPKLYQGDAVQRRLHAARVRRARCCKGEFRLSEEQATRVMMTAHRKGVCVVIGLSAATSPRRRRRARPSRARRWVFRCGSTAEPEE